VDAIRSCKLWLTHAGTPKVPLMTANGQTTTNKRWLKASQFAKQLAISLRHVKTSTHRAGKHACKMAENSPDKWNELQRCLTKMTVL